MEQEKYRGSEKHIKYMDDYKKDNYDKIAFYRKKGDKDIMTEYAKSHGLKSNSELINLAIDEYMANHK